jgi:hypothetical protein
MRDTIVIALLWSLPIALSLHVVEEFAFPGGLKQWIQAYRPKKPKSNRYYFAVNAVGIGATCIIALTANDFPGGLRVYLYFAALMAGNALSHIRGTIQARRYCPGAVSGGLLLLPLFAISCWYFVRTGRLDLVWAAVSVAVGAFIGFYVCGVDLRKRDHN